MPDDFAWVWERLKDGLRPELPLTVSEWASRYRILPPTSAEPGRWRNDRTPFLAEIMDVLSVHSAAERIVFMKGAQIGATEAGNNWIGYVIHNAPGLMLAVLPSLDDIKRNSATRIDPLIECSPVLKERVVEPGSREPGNSMFRKKFLGGELVLTGATSAKGLRSTPARYLFMDEIDAYPADADDEGDPVALAVQRTVTFKGRRKIYLVSTPTLKGFSRIEAAYLESDQRIFEVPCAHCGDFSRILWADIHWPEGQRGRAYWACPLCGGIHEEGHKPHLISGGRWRATTAGDGRTAGFHLSGLYSPFETWGEIAIEHGAAKSDPVRLKAWVNLKLGESWEDPSGETVEPQAIAGRDERGDWRAALPRGVAVLTAAVDLQDNRLELEVVGWGKDEESWSIEYRQLYGDPGTPALWQELDDLLQRTFPHTLAIPDLAIAAACLDVGGHHTQAAYNFVRGKDARRVWAVKGHNIPGKAIWPRKLSKDNRGRVPLYMVGVSAAKEAIYARLKITEPGPGFLHFPADRPDTYFRQLTAERMKTVYVKGRATRVWEAGSRRNEALDLKVYNLAALYGLQAIGFDLNATAATLSGLPDRVLGQAVAAPAIMRRKPTRSTWLSG
jgi:phage terminase large subunit GpA-like protein